ncbi:hypothetical protein [Corallococcus interemptor]|uniref:hypothetical protein n=1 Tax=Corallococcus interemptor TaxID=2316720 RepID=UPI0011C3F464|nr:hypothetical protein [Corallococcus interemptor]
MSMQKGRRYPGHHLLPGGRMSSLNLNTLDGLRRAIAGNIDVLRLDDETATVGNLYCPRCSAERRVTLKVLHHRERLNEPLTVPARRSVTGPPVAPAPLTQEERFAMFLRRLEAGMSPFLFTYSCLQCECLFTGVVYDGPDGEGLALFPKTPGGIATTHTPKAVAYYLDQAARCQSVGALSAAMAMYRASLEHILGLAGYKGMLHAKVQALVAAIDNKSAPDWGRRLNVAYLTCIKEIGNAAIHANGGDIAVQEHITPGLVSLVQMTLEEIIERAFEEPARDKARLDQMQAVAAAMPKK